MSASNASASSQGSTAGWESVYGHYMSVVETFTAGHPGFNVTHEDMQETHTMLLRVRRACRAAAAAAYERTGEDDMDAIIAEKNSVAAFENCLMRLAENEVV